ncbi:MAG: hypothetical protein ACRDRZ_13625 [Pseudonocardiaceae bacterium]
MGCGDRRCDFFDFDVFAGEGRVFEFIATTAQCAEPVQRPTELGAHSVADCKVPAGLSGSQTLLRQERFADEPGGIIGEDKRRLWVVDSDGLGGVQSAPRFRQPWHSVGAGSSDPFEVASSQELLDLLGAL